jgi:phosphoribosylformylglycinamidine cyclo-ligase
LAETGGIETREMLKTFNAGIGMCVVVDAAEADAIARLLVAAGETVTRLGVVEAGSGVTYEGALS